MVSPKHISKISVSGNKYHDLFCGGGFAMKFFNILWGVRFAITHGKPNKLFAFGGGLGDHLMVTSVFKEYQKRKQGQLWMMSDFPDIFENNTDVDRIVPDNWRVEKYCQKFGVSRQLLSYGNWIDDPDRIEPPKKHILAEILERAGISGQVELRPYYPAVQSVSPEEHSESDIICIQGTNTASSTPMLNKQWSEDRFAEIGSVLGQEYRMVQLGLSGESDIPAAEDFRGKLNILETAEMLAKSRFFIGQVGFLMHLARAVGTRSIIIYGGREKAWQSGYPCNENLETNPECSPCWRNSGCEYNRKCLSDVTVQDLLDAVDRMELRLEQPLETESVTLP